jgi:hypothetical protein
VCGGDEGAFQLPVECTDADNSSSPKQSIVSEPLSLRGYLCQCVNVCVCV